MKKDDNANGINPDDIVDDAKGRILASKKKKVSDKEKMQKLLKNPIFASTTLNLKDYKVDFDGEGMNPLKDKEKSAINKTSYANFQKKLQQEQLSQMEKSNPTTTPVPQPAETPKKEAQTTPKPVVETKVDTKVDTKVETKTDTGK